MVTSIHQLHIDYEFKVAFLTKAVPVDFCRRFSQMNRHWKFLDSAAILLIVACSPPVPAHAANLAANNPLSITIATMKNHILCFALVLGDSNP